MVRSEAVTGRVDVECARAVRSELMKRNGKTAQFDRNAGSRDPEKARALAALTIFRTIAVSMPFR